MECYSCHNEKSKDLFVKNKSLCKSCDSLRGVKKRFESLCEKYDIGFSEQDHITHKICNKCISKKELSMFKGRRSSLCLSCAKENRDESQRKFHERNPNAAKENQKAYYRRNADIILKKQRERSKEPGQREKTRLRKIEYRKNTIIINTPEQKLRHNISCRIRKAIRKNGESMVDILPYTIKELRMHLESQFESRMTWDNWGKYSPKTWDDNDKSTWTWQVDHIVCQSDLPYDSMKHTNFKKCWSLDNLRPLSAKQNVMDGVNRVRHGGV